jgi:hypothetical protein
MTQGQKSFESPMTSADAPISKRIKILQENGQIIYSTTRWPGWRIFRLLLFFVVVLGLFEGVIIFIRYQMVSAFQFSGWFGHVLGFLIGVGPFVTFEFVILLFFIMTPFLIIDHLSSKRVWIDKEAIYIKKRFFGWLRCKRIPKDMIINLELAKNGSPGKYLYDIQVIYWLNLPIWLPAIILDKIDRWAAIALNAIPSKQEADDIMEQLLAQLTEPEFANNGG